MPGHQARTTLLLRVVWIWWIYMRTLRMMGWIGRGFWKAFRQLRESEAMRMMGTGDRVARSSALSKTFASAVKMEKRGAKGAATALLP
jgi:hypothetical protein